MNSSVEFPGMFQAEKQGLEELKKAGAIDVPGVLGCGEIADTAFLILEHKKQGTQKGHFWKLFAEGLSALHKVTAPQFGFHSSNYIGSLPQENGHETSAANFYIRQRLQPQFEMAAKNGFAFEGLDRVYDNISEEIPKEPPALIHGDLWNGNYITNEEGSPCLIDPAVSYGPREMDLAMMKLFGGFPETVFSEYRSAFPLEPDFENRISMWQLYYLLVHLNIFGRSYLPQVERIVKSFS